MNIFSNDFLKLSSLLRKAVVYRREKQALEASVIRGAMRLASKK